MKWIVSHKTAEKEIAIEYADDVRFYPNWVCLINDGEVFLRLNNNNVLEVRKEKNENKIITEK